MIFVESKVFTHARYWKILIYVCMIFFVRGHLGGHREFFWGARAPPPPPRPPVAKPLSVGGVSPSHGRDFFKKLEYQNCTIF